MAKGRVVAVEPGEQLLGLKEGFDGVVAGAGGQRRASGGGVQLWQLVPADELPQQFGRARHRRSRSGVPAPTARTG